MGTVNEPVGHPVDDSVGKAVHAPAKSVEDRWTRLGTPLRHHDPHGGDLPGDGRCPVDEEKTDGVPSYGALVTPAPQVEVRRSMRRRRTVSAYRDGDTVVVLLPGRMTRADERRWVTTMLERLEAQDQRRRPSDPELLRRAEELSRQYLDGRARPSSVRWVANQKERWGSCTPEDGSIRISSRLRGLPEWVLDYVLLHELAHLVVPGHGVRFWALLEGYPRTERARGYLEGWSAATRSASGVD